MHLAQRAAFGELAGEQVAALFVEGGAALFLPLLQGGFSLGDSPACVAGGFLLCSLRRFAASLKGLLPLGPFLPGVSARRFDVGLLVGGIANEARVHLFRFRGPAQHSRQAMDLPEQIDDDIIALIALRR